MHFTYDAEEEHAALDGVSFAARPGQLIASVGPSGSGKSTVLNLAARLYDPTGGAVSIDSIDLRDLSLSSMSDLLGFVTQESYLFAGTIRSNIAYARPDASDAEVEKVARAASIHDRIMELPQGYDTVVGERGTRLSGGERQRVAIARVLLHDPELLLLDEPTSGLDPRARIEVRELLKALTEMGKTILISSHILHELAHLCTRIGIIETGEMVAQGTMNDIYRKLSLLRVVHVQLADTSPDLIDSIRAIPGVEEVEEQVDRIAMRLHEDQISIEDLHQALVDTGARIRMFQPEAMDMETAFMKLTEGKTA